MSACPERRNVVDMTEPSDAGLLAPACGLLVADRRRVGRVRRPREQKLDIRAPPPQQPKGADQLVNAFVGQQPADISDGWGTFWLWHRLQGFDIDAGARDQHDSFRRDAEREYAIAVVGVLHQHELLWTVQQ